MSKHYTIDKAGVTIFSQGEKADGYYVIIRGTVKIEQQHLRFAHKPDMPPVVIRTCYDGDQFGEVTHFTANVEKLSALCGEGAEAQDQLDLKNNKEDSIFEKQIKVSDEMVKDLSPLELEKLNSHRTTATTME